MRRTLMALFLILLSTVALAQEKNPTLFFVPINVGGNVHITAKEFNDTMLRTISEVAPQVRVTVGDVATDSESQALAMARKAGCQYVLYGKVEANKDSLLLSMGGDAANQPGAPMTVGTPQRYLVFLRGQATLNALEVSTKELLATQPEQFYRSQVSVVDDENVERALSADFIEQISHRVLEHMEVRIRRNRAGNGK